MTLSKYITKYDHVWKLIIGFLRKFLGRSIKMEKVNSIRFPIPLIFFIILLGVAR